MRSFALAAATLTAAVCLAKSPVTHEALWLMKRVGAPAVSPDGKWVVFGVVEPSYEEKDQISDLWITSADGSAQPRRLTATKGGESGVTWAPDSRRIAFSAKREGDEMAQIYVLDVVGGGEAQRVTSVSHGASSPKFSPDGGRIAFVTRMFPGAADDASNKKLAAERKARKHKTRVYESFPVRQWDHWRDDQKPHLAMQMLAPGSAPQFLLAGSKLIEEPGFGGASTSESETFSYDWAPDGQSLIFAATVNRNVSAYANSHTDLYQVAVNGGEPKRLTSGGGSHGSPQFRPDGKALYFSIQAENDKVYNLTRLAMMPWPAGGATKVVTADSDLSVMGATFSSDSKTVYFTAEDAGLVKVFQVPAAGGKVAPALPQEAGVYGAVAAAEKAPVIVGTWESAVQPAEVVRIDLAGRKHARLTEFNVAKAADLAWLPVRHFWHTSKDGRKVHSVIVLPPDFRETGKYPLVVFPHGGPANMSRDQISLRWNYHLIANPGYVVIMTNYKGSTGFGEKFGQSIQLDPLKGPGQDILDAAEAAAKQFPFIDASRQCAIGASYGGHLTNWFQGTTTHFKCLVSHAGLVNLESQWGTSDSIYHRELTSGGPVWEQGPIWREQNPIRYAKNFKTPMMVTIGEKDYRVPLNNSLENWSVLQRLKVPSKLVVFENANHWILNGEDSKFFYGELLGWLKKWL